MFPPEEEQLLSKAGYESDDHSINGSGGGHKKTTTLGAIFNFICVTVGAGILSLPGALNNAGWFGIFFFILLAMASNFTAQLLIACMHSIEGRRLTTYEEIGEAVWGRAGKILVGVFQVLQLFGVCVIFLILIGLNLQALARNTCLTYHDWILIIVAGLLPVTWLKTMREISVLAFFGLVASLVVAITVVVVGFYQLGENHHSGVIGGHVFITDFQGVIASFNTAVFGFGVHSILPTVENSMERPKDFPMVSNISFTFITEIYILVAIAGYAGFGTTLGGSGNVLEAMAATYNTGFLSVLVDVVTAIITAHIVCAFPLPMNPINLALEKALGTDRLPPKKELIFRIVLRSCVMAIAVVVASVVPYFGDFLNFISAIAGIFVAFILPVTFYYFLNRHRDIPRVKLAFMGLVFVLGVMGFAAGMYFSTKGLISDLQQGGPFENYFVAAKCAASSSSSASSSS